MGGGCRKSHYANEVLFFGHVTCKSERPRGEVRRNMAEMFL